jgi:hypothetical protein
MALESPHARTVPTEGPGDASPVDARLDTAWQVLRVGLGLGAFVAGLDKFFDLLTTWSMYLSPVAEHLLPLGNAAFMRCVGVVEMLLGVAILTRWTRPGSYAMAAWLLAIAANLLAAGNFRDLALRDVQIALSAFTLGRLSEWRANRIRIPGEKRGPDALLHGGVTT